MAPLSIRVDEVWTNILINIITSNGKYTYIHIQIQITVWYFLRLMKKKSSHIHYTNNKTPMDPLKRKIFFSYGLFGI